MKALTSNTIKYAVGAGSLVGAAASQAAVDTAPLVASITEAGAAVAVIGAAALGVVAVVKTFKYIRQAF